MSLKTKIVIFSAIIFSTSCTFAAAVTKSNEQAIQNAVLFYINEYRQKHGLSALKMNNKIVTQAKQHSQDMANHRMPFGHKDFQKRISTLRTQIKNTGGGAENVAYNYRDAREVVSQWVLSPGHKRNIVGHYNLTGIGVARDKQGKLYYTQIFLQTNEMKSTITRKHFVRFNPFFSFRRNS